VELLAIVSMVLLAGVFTVSGVAKIVDPEGTRTAVRGFGVAERLVSPVARVLPGFELVVAGMIIIPPVRLIGIMAAIALLLLFTAAVLFNVLQGRTPECRCFGQLRSTPIGWRTAGRNVSLLLVAIVLAGTQLTGSSVLNSEGTNLLTHGLIFIGIVSAAGFEFLALPALFRHNVATEQAPPVNERSVSSGFVLPDIAGGHRSLSDLTSWNDPVGLLFIDPECDLCDEVLGELKSWKQAPWMYPRVQVIGCGTIEEHQAKAARFGIESILVQEDWEVADALGADNVPSLVFINPDNSLASQVVDGPNDIRTFMVTVVTDRQEVLT
jgi:hypothetical protein